MWTPWWRFAVEEQFDYVVVAQDDPLALGMVDALAAVGIPAFGPDKAAARIEASKVFSKDLMKKYGIPTARYETFDDPAKVMDYIRAEGQVPGRHQGGRSGAGQGRAHLRERAAGRRRREGDHAGQEVRRFRQPCGGRGVPHRPGGQRAELHRRQGGQAHGVQHGPQAGQRPRHRPEHRRHGHRCPEPLLHPGQSPPSAWRRSSCPPSRP